MKKIKGYLAAFLLLAGALLTTEIPAQAAELTMILPITQTVEETGSMLTDEEKTFSYVLSGEDSSVPMPAGSVGADYEFSMTGNVNRDIGPAIYTQAGIYTYELKQKVDEPKAGYTYDQEVYTVTVNVKYSDSGELVREVTVKNTSGNKVSSLDFVNSYQPNASDRELMADPPVKKTVTGNPANKGTFVFSLTAENKENPMPEGSQDGVKTMTIVGEGEGEFGTWSYQSAGTYRYTVSEVNQGEQGYTYDQSVYTITDVVTDEDGQLILERAVKNEQDTSVEAFEFQNHYTGTSGPAGNGGISGVAGGVKAGSYVTSVLTGDTTQIVLWGALLGIAAAIIAFFMWRKKKR